MVSSDSAPAVGWATTTCPPGPLSMLRGSSSVASRRCTIPRPSPTTTTCASVSAVASASGSRPAGARAAPSAGSAARPEAEERATIEVHACHYGTAPPDRSAGARRTQQGASTSTLASSRRGPSWTRPTACSTAAAAAVADGAGNPVSARRRPSSPKAPAPGAARSSTPSETRTTSSSAAIFARPGSRGGSRRSSPRTGPSPPVQRAQPALGVPEQRRGMPAAQPRQRRRRRVPGRQHGAHEDLRDLQGADRLVDVDGRGGQVAAAAPRRAIGAQRDRPDGRGLRALADRVGHAEPAAVGHRAMIDPVAADVIGREDRAGHLGALQMPDPRRQQVLLQLGGRAALAMASRVGQRRRCGARPARGRPHRVRPAPRGRPPAARRRRGR